MTPPTPHWHRALPYLAFAYNTSVHASTKMTPYAMMFGREARLPVDVWLDTDPQYGDEDHTAELWNAAQLLALEHIVKAQAAQNVDQ